MEFDKKRARSPLIRKYLDFIKEELPVYLRPDREGVDLVLS